MEGSIRLGINRKDELANKVLLCNKQCERTPESCPFLNFDIDECSVIKTKSNLTFRRAINAVTKRSNNVRGFKCKCSWNEHPVSGKMQQLIERQVMPNLNYPGGEDESNYLREQWSHDFETRGAC